MTLAEALSAILAGRTMTRGRRFRQDAHYLNPGPGGVLLRRDRYGLVEVWTPDHEDAAATDWAEMAAVPPDDADHVTPLYAARAAAKTG
jgi:hypothetical protein